MPYPKVNEVLSEIFGYDVQDSSPYRWIMTNIINSTYDLFDKVTDPSHNFDHLLKVTRHCTRAFNLESSSLPRSDVYTKTTVATAAILHDADDSKVFPRRKKIDQSNGEGNGIYTKEDELYDKREKEFPNATRIIDCAFEFVDPNVKQTDHKKFKKDVLEMISLVSFSSNLNTIPDGIKQTPWKLYPRQGDRAEASGHPGIYRCYVYSEKYGKELFSQTTPRFHSLQDLETQEAKNFLAGRLKRYHERHFSETFIDHFFDKLLHIGPLSGCPSAYFDEILVERNRILKELIVEFSNDTHYWKEFFVKGYGKEE